MREYLNEPLVEIPDDDDREEIEARKDEVRAARPFKPTMERRPKRVALSSEARKRAIQT